MSFTIHPNYIDQKIQKKGIANVGKSKSTKPLIFEEGKKNFKC